jgi:beta-glucanase (GH16 family)
MQQKKVRAVAGWRSGSPERKRIRSNRTLITAAALVSVIIVATVVVAARHKPGWQLSWSDDFNGRSLDPAKWKVENQSTFGNGNQELACLMNGPNNVIVSNGSLTLRAVRESRPVTCGAADSRFPQGREFTSAMVSTKGKASWHQGRFEVRAKLPLDAGSSQGLWPAFWLRPNSGPGDGELDVMEAIGSKKPGDDESTSVHQTVWYDQDKTFPKQSVVAPVTGGGPSAGFHTYAAQWTDRTIRWYVEADL